MKALVDQEEGPFYQVEARPRVWVVKLSRCALAEKNVVFSFVTKKMMIDLELDTADIWTKK